MGNPAWRFEGNERKYVEEVLATGFRAGADGAFTTRLESYFAENYNVPYGIEFNSGTSTLHAALLVMGCGPGDEFVKKLTDLIPIRRMADKDDYRDAVQFLCSPASAYTNGQNIVIDGGRSVL